MKPRTRRYVLIIGIVLFILLVMGYVVYEQYTLTQKADKLATANGQAVSAMSGSDEVKGDDTANETTVPLLDSYTVVPERPRALYINKLSIAARVMPMGLTADGSIQAPKNVNDSGWYTDSSLPGEAGAMFIDGHASGATRMGLFAYIDTLKSGDEIVIEKGDGQKLTYVVRAVETVPKDKLDMHKVLLPYTYNAKGLNLMTCTGIWIPSEKTYDKRVVVYAEQVE